jgi:quinol monooxygenase YgiN
MAEALGILAILEAKPEKAAELGELLAGALQLAQAEPGTVSWYALKLSDTKFAIFDTFADEDGRQAHLGGEIAKALGTIGDMLVGAPDLSFAEILAAK